MNRRVIQNCIIILQEIVLLFIGFLIIIQGIIISDKTTIHTMILIGLVLESGVSLAKKVLCIKRERFFINKYIWIVMFIAVLIKSFTYIARIISGI